MYTPGPWSLRDISGYTHVMAGERYIGAAGIMRKEDARLIEAAPDLVAVIEALLSLNQTQGVTPEEYEAACDAANAVLARIKGEQI